MLPPGIKKTYHLRLKSLQSFQLIVPQGHEKKQHEKKKQNKWQRQTYTHNTVTYKKIAMRMC